MIFRKFQTVFEQLPIQTINGKEYTPVFRFGTEDDLNNFLSVARKSGNPYYPLIWLVTPQEEAHEITCHFVLATLNLRTDMGNFDRLDYTFAATLEPLLDNVISAIKQSRAFKFLRALCRYRRISQAFIGPPGRTAHWRRQAFRFGPP